MPRRPRPCFLWRRKLQSDLARVATRTATAIVRTTSDEPELALGIVLSIQTHGSLLNRQAYVHALVTDGGFEPDETFVRLPAHSTEVLTEAFRRGVLKLFVARELVEPEMAEGGQGWRVTTSVSDPIDCTIEPSPALRQGQGVGAAAVRSGPNNHDRPSSPPRTAGSARLVASE